MSLWEYKHITSGPHGFATPALLESYLNQLGKDEWEIISYQTLPTNALAFNGVARRTTLRDWTLESAAAAAAKIEADKLRAEFAAKFQGNAANASAAGNASGEHAEKPSSIVGDTAAPEDGFRKLRNTERDGDPDAAEENEDWDNWDNLEDDLPTLFEAIKPHLRKNQRGPGMSVGITFLAKRWEQTEGDIIGALKECGFAIPEIEDAPPEHLEFEGELYWLNLNNRHELFLNTREKPRPVYRIAPAKKLDPADPANALLAEEVAAEQNEKTKREAERVAREAEQAARRAESEARRIAAQTAREAAQAAAAEARAAAAANAAAARANAQANNAANANGNSNGNAAGANASGGDQSSSSRNAGEMFPLVGAGGENGPVGDGATSSGNAHGHAHANAHGNSSANSGSGSGSADAAANGSPLPQGEALLDAIRPQMRRNRRGPGYSGSTVYLARAFKHSEADLITGLVSLGLQLPETANDKPIKSTIGAYIYWLNKDTRGGIWINGDEARTPAPAGGNAQNTQGGSDTQSSHDAQDSQSAQPARDGGPDSESESPAGASASSEQSRGNQHSSDPAAQAAADSGSSGRVSGSSTSASESASVASISDASAPSPASAPIQGEISLSSAPGVTDSSAEKIEPAMPTPAVTAEVSEALKKPVPVSAVLPHSSPLSALAGMRLLLKPNKRGSGVSAEVGYLARTLDQDLQHFLTALTDLGLALPETSEHKPSFVENAGEIFWLNKNPKDGSVWLNAKASKAAIAKKSAASESANESASDGAERSAAPAAPAAPAPKPRAKRAPK